MGHVVLVHQLLTVDCVDVIFVAFRVVFACLGAKLVLFKLVMVRHLILVLVHLVASLELLLATHWVGEGVLV